MRGPVTEILEGYLKTLATLLVLGGLFYGGYWYLAIHLPNERRAAEDPVYASEVFDGVLEYEAVLASRRWNRRGVDWDCTFAAVKLPADADASFPSLSASSDVPSHLRYGGDWQATPAPALGDTTRDAVAFCARYFSHDLNNQIANAMSRPGSWYVIGSVGEFVYIYSAPQRIAARIRFGD